jgi:hypothetical protein
MAPDSEDTSGRRKELLNALREGIQLRRVGRAISIVLFLVGGGLCVYSFSIHRTVELLCGKQTGPATHLACEPARAQIHALLLVAGFLVMLGMVILGFARERRPPINRREQSAADGVSAAGPVDSDAAPVFVSLWYLPVTAALFFLVAYLLHTEHGETSRFFKEVSFAIATAFLVSWGFSVILDIPHVTHFITQKLADLLHGDRYLRSIEPSLPEIRRRIDRVLYGEATLAHPGTFYNFINDDVQILYQSSFRRNFTVQIQCSRLANGQARWQETTTYIYVRNRLDKHPTPLRHRIERVLTDAELAVARKDLDVFFESYVNRLRLTIGDNVFTQVENDKKRLKQKDGSGEITVEYSLNEGAFAYWLMHPISEDVLHEKGVAIEILDETVVPARDDLYYSSVSLPTEDFTVVCSFPSDVRLELIRFASGNSGGVDPPSSFGHALATINGWLMPGHGVCVGWFGLAASGMGNRVESPSTGVTGTAS